MFQLSDVKLASFNVNGMQNENKRRGIFNYLRSFHSDIILLQETHSTPEVERVWANEWGSQIIFNHGTSAARGVAILFGRHSPISLESLKIDLEGRYIIADLKIEDHVFVLVNVYGPNEDSPSFFTKLFSNVEARENTSMILAGDFNTSMDPDKDLYNNRGLTHKKKRLVIHEFLEQNNLADVWRIQNPSKRTFTWRKPFSSDLIMSRLDYFFISEDFLSKVNSAAIKPRYKSDHSRVTLDLNFAKVKRGRGYWKINNKHLKDKQFVEKVNDIIMQFKYEVKSKEESPIDIQWENLKNRMTDFAKTFSIHKAKEKSQMIEKFERRIMILDEKLLTLETMEDKKKCLEDIKKTEMFLMNEHDEKVKAAMFRSKAQFYLEGEKNSKYFFNLERNRSRAKIISAIRNESGTIITKPHLILEEEKLFYKRLYGQNPPRNWLFHNDTDIKLTEDEREELDRDFEDYEFSNSLMGMQNNKTPGLDGLSADFYKVFWVQLKDIFGILARFNLDRQLLHRSARKGVISLLPKKNKDLMELKNWRPLTLLNVDYKIIARALALRLKPKLANLIHEDQTGFLQNRNIAHSIRTVLDVVQIANRKQLSAVIISLDWQKAFDRVARPAMDAAFGYFGFGPKFRMAVQTLFNESVCCVTNNGYLSQEFPSLVGIKQGCNFSPLAFVLLIEVLSQKIRNNSKIKGIKINNELELKLSQFADDMNLFLTFEKETLMEVEDTFDAFEEATGMKVNYDKTRVYRIGSLKNSNAQLYTRKPLSWTNDPLLILGVYVDHNMDNMFELNYAPLISRVRARCDLWSRRGLTLMGKVQIINALCISLFVHKMSVLPRIPEKYVSQFNDIVRKFLWNTGRVKISHEKLYNDKQLGGLKLVDLKTKDDSLKCQWVSTLRDSAKFNSISQLFLTPIGQHIWLCNLKSSHISRFSVSGFWQDVLAAWARVHWHTPTNPSQYAAQSLWLNSHIIIQGSPVLNISALKVGVSFVYNIWNTVFNRFLDFAELEGVYPNHGMTLMQYNGLKSAIPRKWVREIKECRFLLEDYTYLYEEAIGKISTIMYRKMIDNKNILQPLASRWEEKLQVSIQYDKFLQCFEQLGKIVFSTKLRNFQFRYLHRAIFCNNTLYRWKIKDSPLCDFCHQEPGTLEHVFFACSITQTFWKSFITWYENTANTKIVLSLEMVSLCNSEMDLLNTLLITAKQYIFKCKIQDKPLNCFVFRNLVQEVIAFERKNAKEQHNYKAFYKKWKFLLSQDE